MIEKILKNVSIIGFSFVIIFTILSAVQTIYHEETHQAVCQKFNAENITIEYGFLHQSGKTICYSNYSEMHILAQAQVEIEGYHQVPIIIGLSLLNAILIAILFK